MAIPDKFDGYRNAAWLLKRHAVSVLPSVTSLKALRAFARRDQNIKPMTGFGDPLFDPSQAAGDKRAALKAASRSVASLAYTEFWRGAGVDRTVLAQALPQLPDTADELNAVAKDLGVASADIHLGSDASETTLKRTQAFRLFDRLLRHPRPRRRRRQGRRRAVAGAEHSRTADRIRRRPADRERSGAIETQCRLGRAVGLQHHCRRQAGRRGAVGAGALVLLCRRAGAVGDALGGGLRPPQRGSPPRPSIASRPIRISAAPRRCARPCWPTSTIPPRRAMPTRPSGARSP